VEVTFLIANLHWFQSPPAVVCLFDSSSIPCRRRLGKTHQVRDIRGAGRDFADFVPYPELGGCTAGRPPDLVSANIGGYAILKGAYSRTPRLIEKGAIEFSLSLRRKPVLKFELGLQCQRLFVLRGGVQSRSGVRGRRIIVKPRRHAAAWICDLGFSEEVPRVPAPPGL